MARIEIQRAISISFGKPFEYGSSDCVTAIADALVLMGYPDYARNRRGYRRIEVLRASREIGLAGLIEDEFMRAGLQRVPDPEPCDLGVSPGRWCAAIYDGITWWAKGESGMVSVAAPTRFWRP